MQSPEPRDDAELTLRELRRLVHGIKTASYSVERACKVTGAQLFVLRELALEPGASIRRLSERTLTDPSSVSVIVARLVEQGYVTRTVDEADRRRTALRITRRGAQVVARAPEPYQARLIGVLRELPTGDLSVLREALARLSDSLGLSREAPLFFEQANNEEGKSRGSQ
jgi:DNA-binding MarR family transcriptional regulator